MQDNPKNTNQWEGEGGQTSPYAQGQDHPQQQYGEHTNSIGQALDGREMYSVPLQPGQKVRAMYIDGQTYEATIRSSSADGSYAVEWYDGSYSEAVPQQDVTPIHEIDR